MRCQLHRLIKGQMIDEWFPLSSHIPLKGIEPGSLRVRARYSMEKIMPEEEYSEFKEVWFIEKLLWLLYILLPVHHDCWGKMLLCALQMILQKDFHVIFALANVCGQDRTLLASLLLKIFRHEKEEAFLLMKLNEKEIKMEGKNKDSCK